MQSEVNVVDRTLCQNKSRNNPCQQINGRDKNVLAMAATLITLKSPLNATIYLNQFEFLPK